MPKYKRPRKIWEYSADFRVKAVELNHQDGIEVQQVAARLKKQNLAAVLDVY